MIKLVLVIALVSLLSAGWGDSYLSYNVDTSITSYRNAVLIPPYVVHHKHAR